MTMALDGSIAGNNGSSSTLVLTLTTTASKGYVCVAVACNGGPVVSVTATGLTFSRAGRNGSFALNCELWVAPTSAAQSGVAITITQTTSSFISGIAWGVSGAPTGLDANGALPSVIGDGSGNATTSRCSITTTSNNGFLIGVYRFHFTSSPNVVSGGGWTRVTAGSFLLAEYMVVSSPQSATDVTIGSGVGEGNNDQNGGVAHSLTAGVTTGAFAYCGA